MQAGGRGSSAMSASSIYGSRPAIGSASIVAPGASPLVVSVIAHVNPSPAKPGQVRLALGVSILIGQGTKEYRSWGIGE